MSVNKMTSRARKDTSQVSMMAQHLSMILEPTMVHVVISLTASQTQCKVMINTSAKKVTALIDPTTRATWMVPSLAMSKAIRVVLTVIRSNVNEMTLAV